VGKDNKVLKEERQDKHSSYTSCIWSFTWTNVTFSVPGNPGMLTKVYSPRKCVWVCRQLSAGGQAAAM